MKKHIRKLVLLLLLALSTVAGAAPVNYRIDVIGTFWDFQATDINNRGQVVGFGAYEFTEGDTTYGNQRAFLWDAGSVKYIQDNTTQIYGTAINDAGVFVGNTYGWTPQAAVLGASGPVLIDAKVDSSWATAINNSGQIAVVTTSSHAYIYSPDGTRTDLGYLGFGTVSDLNDAGTAVGRYSTKNGTHAFSYANGTLLDLGTLTGSGSAAYAINNSGMVVGDSVSATGYFHATIFGASGLVDLGTFGGAYSTAYDVNSLGQVVGYAYGANQQARGFIYENGTMYDLNAYVDSLGDMTVTRAIGINDSGQILAEVSNGRGTTLEVVLSPVPAPSAYATMIAGLALLGTFGARRRIAAGRVAPAAC